MAKNQGEEITQRDDQAENHGINMGIQQSCPEDKGVQDVNEVNYIPKIVDEDADNSNSKFETLINSHGDGQSGQKIPKPKATSTKIMRMDYELGDIIKAPEGPLLEREAIYTTLKIIYWIRRRMCREQQSMRKSLKILMIFWRGWTFTLVRSNKAHKLELPRA